MDLIQRKGAVTEKRGVGLRERVRGIDKMKKERERGEDGGGRRGVRLTAV